MPLEHAPRIAFLPDSPRFSTASFRFRLLPGPLIRLFFATFLLRNEAVRT